MKGGRRCVIVAASSLTRVNILEVNFVFYIFSLFFSRSCFATRERLLLTRYDCVSALICFFPLRIFISVFALSSAGSRFYFLFLFFFILRYRILDAHTICVAKPFSASCTFIDTYVIIIPKLHIFTDNIPH